MANPYDTILYIFKDLIENFANIWTFLITPITIGTLTIAPIYIFTGAGIIAYIVLAITFWIIK